MTDVSQMLVLVDHEELRAPESLMDPGSHRQAFSKIWTSQTGTSPVLTARPGPGCPVSAVLGDLGLPGAAEVDLDFLTETKAGPG